MEARCLSRAALPTDPSMSHKDLPGQRRRKCDEGDEVKRDGEVRGGVVRRSLGWVASRGGESREVTSVREERR